VIENINPQISIIILNWNGRQFLDSCLGSLAEQTLRAFEVVLVDNGSSDGSADFVRERFPWVRLVELTDNTGFAGGNNHGLSVCGGEFIVTLNNDTRAEPDFLDELVKPILADPKVGMVAAKMLNYYQTEIIDGVGLKVATNGFGYNVGVGEQDEGQYDTSQSVFGPCGGAALYRREMIKDVGFFDRDFFAYYEDFDLAWRGRLAGWKSVTAPAAIVYHVHSATSGEWSSFKVYHLHRNKWFNLIKNWPLSILFMNLPRVLFYDFSAFFLSLLKGRGGAAFKARLHVLYFLPKLLRKRWKIQKTRDITTRQAETFFASDEGALRTFCRKMAGN